MNDTTVTLSMNDGSPRRSLLGKLISRRVPQIDVGGLRLSLPDGGLIIRQGDAAGPEAVIEISSWRAVLRMLFHGEHGFADAYLAGEWSTPDLKAVLAWAMLNEKVLARAGAGSWVTRIQTRFVHFRRKNTRSGSRRNIAAHYDLGNAFYQAWLDANMNYSFGD